MFSVFVFALSLPCSSSLMSFRFVVISSKAKSNTFLSVEARVKESLVLTVAWNGRSNTWSLLGTFVCGWPLVAVEVVVAALKNRVRVHSRILWGRREWSKWPCDQKGTECEVVVVCFDDVVDESKWLWQTSRNVVRTMCTITARNVVYNLWYSYGQTLIYLCHHYSQHWDTQCQHQPMTHIQEDDHPQKWIWMDTHSQEWMHIPATNHENNWTMNDPCKYNKDVVTGTHDKDMIRTTQQTVLRPSTLPPSPPPPLHQFLPSSFPLHQSLHPFPLHPSLLSITPPPLHYSLMEAM